MFIMIWWTALFAVLPFGTKPVVKADTVSGWRGAPERPWRFWLPGEESVSVYRPAKRLQPRD